MLDVVALFCVAKIQTLRRCEPLTQDERAKLDRRYVQDNLGITRVVVFSI